MFRNEPISEVARRLNICAEGLATEELLARSALSQARQRLGEEPMRWLFKQCAQVWGSERYPQDDWNDLQVFAIDGALFRTPDTPPLREHFGSGNTNHEQQTPFPMLRLVALMNIRSHVIADAAITPYRKGEIRIAEAFIEGIIADGEYAFFEFAVLGQLETIAPRFGAILLDLEVKAFPSLSL